MRSTSLLTIALALLSVAGCRGNGQFAPLERENRQLEDRVYELEDELEKLCDLYDDCLSKNKVLTEQVEGGGVRPRSERAAPSRSGPSGVDLGDPEVDLGQPDQGEPEVDPDSPDAEPPPSEELHPGPVEDERLPEPPLSRRSGGRERNALAADGTTGAQRTGHLEERLAPTRLELAGLPAAVSPDEPLAFFVEPRDDDGRRIAEPAEIAVAVLAKDASGSPVRVAAWQLSAEETADCVRPTRRGERFYLELDWPESAIRTLDTPRPLAIYVRYVTPAGEELLAETKLGVRQAKRPASSRPSWSPER